MEGPAGFPGSPYPQPVPSRGHVKTRNAITAVRAHLLPRAPVSLIQGAASPGTSDADVPVMPGQKGAGFS